MSIAKVRNYWIGKLSCNPMYEFNPRTLIGHIIVFVHEPTELIRALEKTKKELRRTGSISRTEF
jgi:hypothetical protein